MSSSMNYETEKKCLAFVKARIIHGPKEPAGFARSLYPRHLENDAQHQGASLGWRFSSTAVATRARSRQHRIRQRAFPERT